jgi:two-component system chemotaxis response regulator CheB
MSARVIRAILVDGNAVAAEQLRRDLWGHPVLTLAGVVPSAEQVTATAAEHRADVILLDARHAADVAKLAPHLPLVAIVPADDEGGAEGMAALEAGAVAVWARSGNVDDLGWRSVAAATAHLDRQRLIQPAWPATESGEGMLFAIGGGTGSMPAMAAVLAGLPEDAAGVVVTPLPAPVVAAWADRVGRETVVRLSVAGDGDQVTPGWMLVAPGDRHLLVRPGVDGGWIVNVKDGPAVHHHRPSLDVLFRSAAAAGGHRVAAACLGGVGPDGVAGLLAVRHAGGRTVAESPDTAVCGDRPHRAFVAGAVEGSTTADRIAALLVHLSAGGVPSNRAA